MGAISSALTVSTGLLDWLQMSRDTPLKRMATLHALALATGSVIFVLAIVLGHDDYAAKAVGTAAFILTIVGFLLLTAGATMGGSITYVYGMRVLNLVDEPTRQAIVPAPTQRRRPQRATERPGPWRGLNRRGCNGARRAGRREPQSSDLG